MPEVEDIVYIDGVSDFIVPARPWHVPPYGEPSAILPVANMLMKAVISVPDTPASWTWLQFDILQYPDETTQYGSQRVILLPQLLTSTAPAVLEIPFTPTTPFLRLRCVDGVTGVNWGKLSLRVKYEVMSPAAYNQLMKGKNELDKKLEVAARSITQFNEKLVEADVKQEELVSANTLYTNFLSDEIAAYEALYGTP